MINWGIIGLGNMANHFATAIKKVDNAKLVGVASKSSLKLDKFNKNYNISKDSLFDDYNELIKSKLVNSIYISTLNNTHTELILECIRNNKNILCEKPMGLNIKEVNITSKKLEQSKVFFNEAIAYRSHPQTIELLKIIKESEIGKIKRIESSFGFKVRKINKNSRLFNKELGGGAILDIGCYPISFFRLFCAKDDKLELINAKGTHAITGVDDYAEINLLNKSNIEFHGRVSLKENFDNTCKIFGTKGTIVVPSPWLPEKKGYLEITKSSSYYKKFINTESNVYTIQIKNISNRFNNVQDEAGKLLIDINDSIHIMEILDLWSKEINK